MSSTEARVDPSPRLGDLSLADDSRGLGRLPRVAVRVDFRDRLRAVLEVDDVAEHRGCDAVRTAPYHLEDAFEDGGN